MYLKLQQSGIQHLSSMSKPWIKVAYSIYLRNPWKSLGSNKVAYSIYLPRESLGTNKVAYSIYLPWESLGTNKVAYSIYLPWESLGSNKVAVHFHITTTSRVTLWNSPEMFFSAISMRSGGAQSTRLYHHAFWCLWCLIIWPTRVLENILEFDSFLDFDISRSLTIKLKGAVGLTIYHTQNKLRILNILQSTPT